jgi:hypothetical protein
VCAGIAPALTPRETQKLIDSWRDFRCRLDPELAIHCFFQRPQLPEQTSFDNFSLGLRDFNRPSGRSDC